MAFTLQNSNSLARAYESLKIHSLFPEALMFGFSLFESHPPTNLKIKHEPAAQAPAILYSSLY